MPLDLGSVAAPDFAEPYALEKRFYMYLALFSVEIWLEFQISYRYLVYFPLDNYRTEY